MTFRPPSAFALALVLLTSLPASAATIVVAPGPGTPVQNAIDAALPGDTVKLLSHSEYHEAIVINKRLKLVGDRRTVFGLPEDSSTLIADCANPVAITVAADGVRIKGVRVQGATQTVIDVQGRSKVKISQSFIIANCPADAITGVYVAASSNVKVDGNIFRTSGTDDDTGIHVDGALAGARIRLKKNLITEQILGLVVEGAGAGAVLASGNFVNFNHGTGITLVDADGNRIKRNQASNNVANGIELDATSDGNLIAGNEATGNGGVDVVDNGTGNCWKNNTFGTGTVPPCP